MSAKTTGLRYTRLINNSSDLLRIVFEVHNSAWTVTYDVSDYFFVAEPRGIVKHGLARGIFGKERISLGVQVFNLKHT